MEGELKLFDDLPLFEGGEATLDKAEDRFGHWAYARTLGKILRHNDKPLTIGLFGEWGSGKSTVMNMLLRDPESGAPYNICGVVFNAWRHQGDSFRRQLLISVAKKVYGKESAEYKKLTSLVGLSGDLRETKEGDEEGGKIGWRDAGRKLVELWKWIFWSNEKAAVLMKMAGIAWIILIVAGVLVVAFWKAEVANFLAVLVFGPIMLTLFAAIEKGTKHKLIATLHISQPSTEKARLSYPEQFELEFAGCVKKVVEKEQRLLVVVDDLDRCDEKSIVAALAVIKQFAGKANSVFIVPCDENQVINAVSRDSGNHDYKYESLRKFFDVAVRMDSIPEADLHNYAKYLVDKWKLSPRLAEIAVYSGARDARKVKAFLNSFRARYWMIKERESDSFETGTAKKNIELIAKLTALQEGFPEFYEKVCKQPLMLGKLETSLRTDLTTAYEKQPSVDVAGLIGNDEALKRFLRYTSNIDLTGIEAIIAGKRPELIAGISTGSAIQAALSGGKAEEFAELVKVLDKGQAQKLVDYLRIEIRGLEERNFSVTLRMWVNCVLEIFSNDSIRVSEELGSVKESLADVIVETVRKQESLIKETANLKGIESILQITRMRDELADMIVQTYLKEPTATEATNYIGLFNRRKGFFVTKLEEINSALKNTLSAGNKLLILDQLLDSTIRNDATDPIPSESVINAVVEQLDPKDEAYLDNEKRLQVIRAYSEQVDMSEFVKKWNEMSEKAQTKSISIEKTNFGIMLDTLNEIRKLEEKEDAEEICPSLLKIWDHNGEKDTRAKLLISFTLIYPLIDEQSAKKVRTAIVTWLNDRPAAEIKAYLKYLTNGETSSLSKEKRESLKGLAVFLLKRFVLWVKEQVNAYNERVEEIVDLIVEWNPRVNVEEEINGLVKCVIRDTNDVFFVAWHKNSLGNLCECLSEGTLQSLGETVINKIESPQTTEMRRSLLLNTLITKLSPKYLAGNETDRMFKLLWHDDGNMRNPVCQKFESLTSKFEDRDFRRNIAIMAGDISNSSVEKITQKANSISSFLANSQSLKKRDRSRVLTVVPSLIRSTNSKESIGIGLEILEAIPVEDEASQDIVSGLKALFEHSDENVKQRAAALAKEFTHKGNKRKVSKEGGEEF